MSLTPAPLFTDIYPGPDTGLAHWIETSDGKRLRVAHWTVEGAKGTVLLFPGRTEYVEKYGVIAAEFAKRGLAVMAIDWRGQGLADRMLPDRRIGYVDTFSDYQKDVAAMMRAARNLQLPRPFFLLAHSMGGCIGLRAVMEGLSVQAAAFTGPMWGIHIAPHLRPFAAVLSHLMPKIGQGHSLPMGTKLDPYVTVEPFEDNMLTTDASMYDMMRDQLAAHPDLSLGGPSYVWLREALSETNHLALRAAPSLPCITLLGSNERIVHLGRIRDRMATWTSGQLQIVEGAEHEILMETPKLRDSALDDIARLFLGNAKS
ncbi:alpha/beta fold hydrolase [Sulfitobacter sp.]|jgi:lysophospholipase|uniref:alpha/beta fold hydrolase n=1 Tax=unclassified Sulfitobacter TaxID=196795 RepID=UPI001B75D6DA|nr:alpha/beta hydrolase [uncultured Sulfitobacter sp.]MBQ0803875.1 alpha/beta hydrolase [Sulfitobacter sp.]